MRQEVEDRSVVFVFLRDGEGGLAWREAVPSKTCFLLACVGGVEKRRGELGARSGLAMMPTTREANAHALFLFRVCEGGEKT